MKTTLLATEDMNKGLMMNTHLSPLACVWASLQVLIGDVSSALRSVLYWCLGQQTTAVVVFVQSSLVHLTVFVCLILFVLFFPLFSSKPGVLLLTVDFCLAYFVGSLWFVEDA